MGKRGNGEGSITRRKDGLYMARYTVQTTMGSKCLFGKVHPALAKRLSMSRIIATSMSVSLVCTFRS
jgi:integrase